MPETTATAKGKKVSLQPNTPLWNALSKFSFDKDVPYSFSKRLAEENEWSHELALRIVEEYRKIPLLARDRRTGSSAITHGAQSMAPALDLHAFLLDRAMQRRSG